MSIRSIYARGTPADLLTPGLRWSNAIDAFGLGCVMAEVWMGAPVFPMTNCTAERVVAVGRVVGAFSDALIQRAGVPFTHVFQSMGNAALGGLGRRCVADAVRHRKIRALRLITVRQCPRRWSRDLLNDNICQQEMIRDTEYAQTCLGLMQPDPDRRWSVGRVARELHADVGVGRGVWLGKL